MPGLYPGFYPGSTAFPGVTYPDPDPTWWLGPLGRLRRLPVPKPGIEQPSIRFGGIHQGLSGTRTVDVTGYRQEYKFTFDYMTPAEWQYLELLHHRHIQGPYYLINPLKPNRISARAIAGRQMDPVGSIRGGVSSNAELRPVRDGDYPPASAGALVATELPEWEGSLGFFVFDREQPFPILPGEYLSVGVWMRGTTHEFDVQVLISWYDKHHQPLTPGASEPIEVRRQWTHVTVEAILVPAGAAGATFGILIPSASIPGNHVRFAGPQANGGRQLKPFMAGHGAPQVVIDQLTDTSPRFPLRSGELTVLEV